MGYDVSYGRSVQARCVLARAWHSKGRLAAAIEGYREVLSLEPGHLEAAILLGAVMQSQLRLDEALQVYRQALEFNPNDARLHKQFVNVLLAQEGTDAVFRHYRLVRRDPRYLNLRPAEIVCCTPLRDELPRLRYFLEYYRAKGIGAFLAVDNGSSDGTCEYLLEQPDVYLWQSDLPFNRANFGAGWFEPILRMYAQDHWCLIVDADELLYYPECEKEILSSCAAPWTRRESERSARLFSTCTRTVRSGKRTTRPDNPSRRYVLILTASSTTSALTIPDHLTIRRATTVEYGNESSVRTGVS